MRGGKTTLIVVRAVAIGVGTVCSGVAVNQIRLDRLSWPWLVAAALAAIVVAALSLVGHADRRRTNRAVAEGGGHADAGNLGRSALRATLPSNDAKAVGPGSVARAGDDYRGARHSDGPTGPLAGE
jgi:hypothetical protein